MLSSQFMNASNPARDLKGGLVLAAQGLDQVANALEAHAASLREESARILDASTQVRTTAHAVVHAEKTKATLLGGVQSLSAVASEATAHADHLAALAHTAPIKVSTRLLAQAMGVSTNTGIKRIRNASNRGGSDG